MAWNVLVHNSVVQLQDPGPPPSFLRAQPPGVYTTTRTTNNTSCLLLWERHLERLSQSIRLMSETVPDMFPRNQIKIPQFDKYLKSIIEPSLSKGLQRAFEIRTSMDELTVMTFITGLTTDLATNTRNDEYGGFEVYVHVSRCKSVCPETVGQLAIMGPGRMIPNVKHSEWVKTRKVLEMLQPKDATETLLSNDGDSVLEGLTTNFFVVLPSKENIFTERRGTVIEKTWENIILQTAPLEGVLPGVIRKLILEICEEQGIVYKEAAPSWKDRCSWLEAFTSNGVRLIQPVGSIRCPIPWDLTTNPQDWKDKSWECLEFEAPPGNLTQFLQEHIRKKERIHSVLIESLFGSL